MRVKMRQEVERKIATALIQSALSAGYAISVDNGEDEETAMRANAAVTVRQMFTTDVDRLYMWKDGKRIGWVFFVYGNYGYDVISDYTTNLEPIMTKARTISDHYAD